MAPGENHDPAGSANSNPTKPKSPRQPAAAAPTRAPGVIDASAAYTTAEFCRRCGLGNYAWRQLRRQLPVRPVGKKKFILGEDWLNFLRQQAPHD
jgi:hypothetical protein